jgi:hypothetical protein
MERNKIHNSIVNNFDQIKQKHLEKLATKMLKDDEKNTKLRSKEIDPKFLNLF